MKHIQKFEEVKLKYTPEESEKERIPIMELIDDARESDEEFDEICEEESIKYAVILYLRDNSFPKLKGFKLEHSYDESGDNKDEETIYGIFSRKLDNKLFKIWVHDAGFIGPSTLTLCEYLEEVSETQPKISRRFI